MKKLSVYFLSLISILSISCVSNSKIEDTRTVKVKLGIENNRISDEWKSVLSNRKSTSKLDSLSNVLKQLTKEEQDWINLINSKTTTWNAIRDSIKVPFHNIKLKDTVHILLGYLGGDDAFTYRDQTICLNVNALHKAYGSAKKTVNNNRIDRIFAHEFTHLLHKKWAKKNNLKLNTFKDQVLWECVTEGFGMYRSMSTKWFPVKDSISLTSKKTFKNLYPKFTKNIIKVFTDSSLSDKEKNDLQANLSKGSMKKKWGALPVAVWLALEAKGDDRNLRPIIEKGPEAIIQLAEKHLTSESEIIFDKFLKKIKTQEIIK